MKKMLVLMILSAFMLFMCGCSGAPAEIPDVAGDSGLTVTLSAVDDEGNVIIPETKAAYTDGMNAFDALNGVAAVADVKIIHSSGYVTSIGGLAAGDKGEMSGWLFYVNGESPTVGAVDCVLAPDDVVLWEYTADFQ